MESTADRTLVLAIRIQQIPAPSFQEHERAIFVEAQFRAVGLADVEIDPIGNVYGRLAAKEPNGLPPLVVSAHLDTVFPVGTPLEVKREGDRIYGPGLGDNSLAVAGLLGLAQMLSERNIRLPGDLWLVANVREEGLGDLGGMKAAVARFGAAPAAYLVLEGTALDKIYHRALSVRRYKISFKTVGGHSWGRFGQPSAIHEMAKFIARLAELEVPIKPRTTYNVGIVEGGTSINTIAPDASLQLDLRSESAAELENLVGKVEALAQAAASDTVEVKLEIIGDRPGGEISSDHPLVVLAMRSLAERGVEPHLTVGSTDANVPLSLGLPAICIGLSYGGGGHTIQEYIHPAPLSIGLEYVLDVVMGISRN